ncbi:tetratricopeptide repeat protein [Nannocystis bainbridge]|uniref:Tetratricopeptide repeat protein n=1 Tax=Nannocystis bainbridge TaxID=2995303 RepID=A0ABT5DVA7_9BACT|nr:tetratricopeptide repeat protein [Nannocystis bainbridge]MDC0717080.1 tetratricopeptide repeat protein [Nannocystis bainbridge]
MSFKTADEAYAEGERRARAGEVDAALAAFEAAIKLDPRHAGALNYAGWLLTTSLSHRPEAMGQGLDLLRDAVAAAPDTTAALYNFADACVAVGQPAEALVPVEAALQRRPDWAEVWNLRGWLRGVKAGDPRGGLEDLQQALARRAWYGDAYLNRARIFLALGEHAEAESALRLALRCGCYRPAEAHLRLAGLVERRGHLRRAVGHFRRAVELGAADSQQDALGGVVRCGNALLHRGVFFLHADEQVRLATTDRDERRPRPLAAVLLDVRAELARTPDDPNDPRRTMGRMGLMASETCCEGHVLEPRWADQSPPLAIEMLATCFTGERHDALRRLAEDVRRIWLELYDELLAREEPDPEAAALADVERLAGERDHVSALAALRAIDVCDDVHLLRRASVAERLGDRARLHGDPTGAHELYRLAHGDFARHASYATAGGEGMARMLDVNRLNGKLSDLGDR